MNAPRPPRDGERSRHGKERDELLREWLDANVRRYATPALVTLSAFDVDWKRFGGSFAVQLDDFALEDRFSFELDVAGRPQLILPMFVSPLGVPASFAAVHLTGATEAAILTCLQSVLPRVLPLGRDPRTGGEITMLTPIEQRVLEPDRLSKAMTDLRNPGWTVSAKPMRVDLGG
jgi:hypothetical protein